MPHVILQTKISFSHSNSEVLLFGPIEREAIEALHSCTFAVLQTWDVNASPPAFWRPAPFSPHAMQIFFNLPGTWECRRTLLNVLRVSWLDILDQHGWNVRSVWNLDKPPPISVNEAVETRTQEAKEASDFKGECTNTFLSKDLSSKHVSVGAAAVGIGVETPGSSEAGDRSGGEDSHVRAGGLTLPDCVQALLTEPNILRWDPVNRGLGPLSPRNCSHIFDGGRHFQVIDGSRFEERFNQLRRVRAKHKLGAVERPFSRMHNFYVLERGDKWAKTGSLFKPKYAQYAPKILQATLSPLVNAATAAAATVPPSPSSAAMSALMARPPPQNEGAAGGGESHASSCAALSAVVGGAGAMEACLDLRAQAMVLAARFPASDKR